MGSITRIHNKVSIMTSIIRTPPNTTHLVQKIYKSTHGNYLLTKKIMKEQYNIIISLDVRF